MIYKYIFHELAHNDYEKSLSWYANKSILAAENFIQSVDTALELICNYPKRWHNKYKNYYELSLKKFPFTIIYIIDTDKKFVIVTAVYHSKRNPKRKYRKI